MGFLRRPPHVFLRKEEGYVLLFNRKTARLYKLNNVGSFVISSCDGTKNLNAVVDLALQNFEGTTDTTKGEVEKFIDQLLQLGLIEEIQPQATTPPSS